MYMTFENYNEFRDLLGADADDIMGMQSRHDRHLAAASKELETLGDDLSLDELWDETEDFGVH